MLNFIIGIFIGIFIANITILLLKLECKSCNEYKEILNKFCNDRKFDCLSYEKFLKEWWNEFQINHHCNMCGKNFKYVRNN